MSAEVEELQSSAEAKRAELESSHVLVQVLDDSLVHSAPQQLELPSGDHFHHNKCAVDHHIAFRRRGSGALERWVRQHAHREMGDWAYVHHTGPPAVAEFTFAWKVRLTFPEEASNPTCDEDEDAFTSDWAGGVPEDRCGRRRRFRRAGSGSDTLLISSTPAEGVCGFSWPIPGVPNVNSSRPASVMDMKALALGAGKECDRLFCEGHRGETLMKVF
eukprot:CAMPEP_0115176152 /NCGR_PEP_ID=MMETSP0270-20121206/4725_1 /TAXON_ID=71861 /ORGANISM="Scrippsiella trochoidea, Strain CCMP3099" /LENGTH=216 /DNA_ID=CAMNT_0002589049 /DNA_START=177 /DNA_END=828 /DNA_ORIENTATION=+